MLYKKSLALQKIFLKKRNDATMKDAIEVGLDKVGAVVDNGTEIAGTFLDAVSKDAICLLIGSVSKDLPV